jgi:hypothetical protein
LFLTLLTVHCKVSVAVKTLSVSKRTSRRREWIGDQPSLLRRRDGTLKNTISTVQVTGKSAVVPIMLPLATEVSEESGVSRTGQDISQVQVSNHSPFYFLYKRETSSNTRYSSLRPTRASQLNTLSQTADTRGLTKTSLDNASNCSAFGIFHTKLAFQHLL